MSRRTTTASSSKTKQAAPVDAGNLNPNRRSLIFTGKDIGRNIDLMLTFEKLSDKKLGYDQQRVCWKVIRLGKKGNQTGMVTFTANTAFFIPQADAGNVVFPLISGPCGTGQKVSLQVDGGDMSFTDPAAGSDGFMEAVNNVGYATDIGIGFTDDNGDNLNPSLIFKRVGAGAAVKAQFTPVVKIYATSNYQENELLRGEIDYPLIWTGELMQLDVNTRLRVTMDPIGNVPKIIVM